MSLVLIDLDHFKGLNDTLGHGAADNALVAVAGELARVAHRTADLAARYGGDELAVVLPGTSADGAQRVARQIQTAVRSLNIANPGSKVSAILTVSQGVATAAPSKKGSCSSLMLAADRALLNAKQAGKNRIAPAPSSKATAER
jgi:diguanylate cyclase (GGDEF)-like protein